MLRQTGAGPRRRQAFLRKGRCLTGDASRPTFDLAVLDRHTAGDRELMIDVVRMFLEDCPIRVEAIRAAIEDADAGRIRATAHSLKGAAAYLSAGFVVDAAAGLEAIGLEGRVAEATAGLERLDAAVAQLIPELRSLLKSVEAD